MENIFNLLLSLSDAAKQWNLDDSTLRKAIASGKLKEGVDVQKYGKQWVITKAAMIRYYGEPTAKA